MKVGLLGFGAALSALSPLGCSAGGGSASRHEPGLGTGGGAGTIGLAGNGVGAEAGSSGFGGFGGTAGGPVLTEDAACSAFSQTAENKLGPSDIIIAPDQSGSMDNETKWIRDQLNGFSQQIIASGIDVRVILIAGISGENPLCIDAPLGAGACPTSDDNPPRFKHVDQHVDSHDAFEQIIATFDQYKDMLRPGASKHVVVISDDESKMNSGAFDAGIKAKDPALFADYIFHAIVAPVEMSDLQCFATPNPCCGIAAGAGQIYMGLVQQTGGVFGDLCLQNFQPVWDSLKASVITTATLSCEWDIPIPADGQMLDPNQVNVRYTGGGQQQDLGRVNSAAECAGFQDAWYYDDPIAPTKVIVCPDLCAQIQAGQAQRVDILFGCATLPPIPK